MSRVFEFNPALGSFQDAISGTIPVNTACLIQNQEKGRCAYISSSADLDGYGVVSGVKTIVSVIKHTADTKLFQDDGSDKLEITGGAMSGTGMTQNYVNNADTNSVTNDTWQLVITEFSAGINFATDFEIDPTASLFLQRVVMYDSILTTAERENLYQEFRNAQTIQKSIIHVGGLRNVGNFDGADSKITVADDSAIQNIFDGGGTVFVVVNPRSDGEGNAARITDKATWFFLIIGEVASKIKISLYQAFSGDNGDWISTNREININKFSSIAMTYNTDSTDNDPVIYINNSSVTLSEDTAPTGTRITDVGQDIIIGNRAGNDRTFDGMIAEVQLFNVILTTTELTRLHKGELIGRSPAGHWKLDEGSGVTAFDSSGNANHGVITPGSSENDFWQQTRGKLSSDDVFFSEDGTNWNADGVTKNTGDWVGENWRVDSGTFRAKEDATGKYLDCVTNGDITFEGVDLSGLIGNGYIRTLTGDLSDDAEDTIANATNVAWADNKLTLTLTAGQVLRSIIITREA